jgi:hypothetical protein
MVTLRSIQGGWSGFWQKMCEMVRTYIALIVEIEGRRLRAAEQLLGGVRVDWAPPDVDGLESDVHVGSETNRAGKVRGVIAGGTNLLPSKAVSLDKNVAAGQKSWQQMRDSGDTRGSESNGAANTTVARRPVKRGRPSVLQQYPPPVEYVPGVGVVPVFVSPARQPGASAREGPGDDTVVNFVARIVARQREKPLVGKRLIDEKLILERHFSQAGSEARIAGLARVDAVLDEGVHNVTAFRQALAYLREEVVNGALSREQFEGKWSSMDKRAADMEADESAADHALEEAVGSTGLELLEGVRGEKPRVLPPVDYEAGRPTEEQLDSLLASAGFKQVGPGSWQAPSAFATEGGKDSAAAVNWEDFLPADLGDALRDMSRKSLAAAASVLLTPDLPPEYWPPAMQAHPAARILEDAYRAARAAGAVPADDVATQLADELGFICPPGVVGSAGARQRLPIPAPSDDALTASPGTRAHMKDAGAQGPKQLSSVLNDEGSSEDSLFGARTLGGQGWSILKGVAQSVRQSIAAEPNPELDTLPESNCDQQKVAPAPGDVDVGRVCRAEVMELEASSTEKGMTREDVLSLSQEVRIESSSARLEHAVNSRGESLGSLHGADLESDRTLHFGEQDRSATPSYTVEGREAGGTAPPESWRSTSEDMELSRRQGILTDGLDSSTEVGSALNTALDADEVAGKGNVDGRLGDVDPSEVEGRQRYRKPGAHVDLPDFKDDGLQDIAVRRGALSAQELVAAEQEMVRFEALWQVQGQASEVWARQHPEAFRRAVEEQHARLAIEGRVQAQDRPVIAADGGTTQVASSLLVALKAAGAGEPASLLTRALSTANAAPGAPGVDLKQLLDAAAITSVPTPAPETSPTPVLKLLDLHRWLTLAVAQAGSASAAP